ncbi:Lactamase-B domain-containing protein [Mycena indigotica]|uniref:Lactamase-B domain-containing protein n=1 Tax=Mycena indigotica TaxID=2126181 RepID=A0A8H6TDZ1_9AGAR|nr:Lactamase-B domain-containing protein [Mycena indigotica]KAF7315705.1 Lactamase-B domain-containing protein [Mycena indigotica]
MLCSPSLQQYIVSDPVSRDAALIDTVLDFEPTSGAISTHTADKILSFIDAHSLNVKYILETHAHADHLTAAQYFRHKLPGVPVGIGARISQVQNTFAPVYGLDSKPDVFNGVFDLLFKDDEEIKLGSLICRVLHLPGHTPDHIAYLIGDAVFVGDSIFQPDVGSARADFPGGDPKALYSSMQRLMNLPATFRLFVGHDYPVDRAELCVSTVAQQRASNKHAKVGVSQEEFVQLRAERDAILGAPRLLHPSLQTNILGGRFPRDENGKPSFKLPISTPISL